MSAADILRRMVEKLDAAGVPHMVAGSFASTYHGVPRSTQDVDIVVDPTPAALDDFLSSLPDTEYYVDADVARDALTRRSQFNVIEPSGARRGGNPGRGAPAARAPWCGA